MRLRRHVHTPRLSGTLIVVVVAGLTLLAGLIGTGVATAVGSVPPFPTNAFAVASPAASSAAAPGGTTVANAMGTVTVPNGYRVVSQSDSLVDLAPTSGHGDIRISMADTGANSDNSSLAQTLIDTDRAHIDPNAQRCADDSVDAFTFHGATPAGAAVTIPAIYLPLCESVVPQNTTAFAARVYHLAAVAQSGSRTVVIDVEISSDTGDFPGLVTGLSGYAATIRWNAQPLS